MKRFLRDWPTIFARTMVISYAVFVVSLFLNIVFRYRVFSIITGISIAITLLCGILIILYLYIEERNNKKNHDDLI